MNGEGKCVVAGANRCRHKQVPTGCAQDESDKKCGKWECSTQCKPLTVFEVDASHCFFLRLPLAYLLRKSDKP